MIGETGLHAFRNECEFKAGVVLGGNGMNGGGLKSAPVTNTMRATGGHCSINFGGGRQRSLPQTLSARNDWAAKRSRYSSYTSKRKKDVNKDSTLPVMKSHLYAAERTFASMVHSFPM